MPTNNIEGEVGTIKRQAIPVGAQHGKSEQRCRVCGCTNYDCGQCIEKTGFACHWVEDDLCSACDKAGRSVVQCRRCKSLFTVIRVAGTGQSTTLARVDDPRICPAYYTKCGGRILDKV